GPRPGRAERSRPDASRRTPAVRAAGLGRCAGGVICHENNVALLLLISIRLISILLAASGWRRAYPPARSPVATEGATGPRVPQPSHPPAVPDRNRLQPAARPAMEPDVRHRSVGDSRPVVLVGQPRDRPARCTARACDGAGPGDESPIRTTSLTGRN